MELREKELACEIVRDLLPLYIDEMVQNVVRYITIWLVIWKWKRRQQKFQM